MRGSTYSSGVCKLGTLSGFCEGGKVGQEMKTQKVEVLSIEFVQCMQTGDRDLSVLTIVSIFYTYMRSSIICHLALFSTMHMEI